MVRRPKLPSRLRRILIARTRLLVSVAAGVVLWALLPSAWRPPTRALLAWDLTTAIYVGWSFWMIARSSVEDCRKRAAFYDESDWVSVAIVVASAAASFVAIFAELAAIRSAEAAPLVSLVVTGATVALSWSFTHVVFTLHYANLYYRPEKDGHHGGLDFPGERAPDYRDFLYYAFVIGCAAQTGDVATLSPSMRRVSLIHGVVAFAFNTAILALAFNVGASLLS